MSLEQLLLVLPTQAEVSTGEELTVHQYTAILEQFAGVGGREVLLGGAEPLAYPGFWLLVRRALKGRIPRVTAYLSGSLLEPWVVRPLVESGVHLLIALDSLDAPSHDALHGAGSHQRAMAALESFLQQGLDRRLGLLATATRLTWEGLPMLAAWAAGRGVSRLLWTTVPDSGWPSDQLRSLSLSLEEKSQLAEQMVAAGRRFGRATYIGPLNALDDPALETGYSRMLRVDVRGNACWGFSRQTGRLGNLKRTVLTDLLDQASQAAGD